jgi:hypothetical protein
MLSGYETGVYRLTVPSIVLILLCTGVASADEIVFEIKPATFVEGVTIASGPCPGDHCFQVTGADLFGPDTLEVDTIHVTRLSWYNRALMVPIEVKGNVYGSVSSSFTTSVSDRTPLPPHLDLDRDGLLTVSDIDMLTTEVLAATHPSENDLNDDTFVGGLDRRVWIDALKNTWFGDANLDLEFDSGDMVSAFAYGGYEEGPQTNAVAVPKLCGWLLSIPGVVALLCAGRWVSLASSWATANHSAKVRFKSSTMRGGTLLR